MTSRKRHDHVATARECLAAQAAALVQMERRIGAEFDQAVKAILCCKGRVVICGIGKSGAVGQKLAATLASTGTPAFFLHAAEAVHGDLGMVCKGDLVILFSYSGETEEVLRLVDSLQLITTPLLCMTGNKSSSLANASQIVLDASVQREVCPHNLAPTTSTLAMMALGDALAVALIKARNFEPRDFAAYHPAGSLGKHLNASVASVMHDHTPVIAPTASVAECIAAINTSGLGLVVVAHANRLLGIITDGDVRRLVASSVNVVRLKARDIMTASPHWIHPSATIAEARSRMLSLKIKALVVTPSQTHAPLGIVDIFSLGRP